MEDGQKMDHKLFQHGQWRQLWQQHWPQMTAFVQSAVAPTAARARVIWTTTPRLGKWSALGALGLAAALSVTAGVTSYRPHPTLARAPIATAPVPAVSQEPSAVVNGHVFVRDTQGAWKELTPKASIGSKDLMAAVFVTDRVGWVTVGHRFERRNDTLEVYGTSDGGATWNKVTLDQFGSFQLSALQITFVNAHDGWALASLSEITNNRPGVLYRTTDGGANWTRIQAPVGGALQFVSADIGWIIGGRVNYARNLLYTTQDGGQTWAEQRLDLPFGAENANVMIGAPAFFSATTGVIAVNLEKSVAIYLTADSGRTWTGAWSLPLQAADHLALPILAAHATNALLAVSAGVYATSDSGATWKQITANANLGSALTLGLNANGDGWAVIARGWCPAQFTSRCNNTRLIATHDGGVAWAPVK
jgi:photosystem II stability/assembly factor-like uncharacterized protein